MLTTTTQSNTEPTALIMNSGSVDRLQEDSNTPISLSSQDISNIRGLSPMLTGEGPGAKLMMCCVTNPFTYRGRFR